MATPPPTLPADGSAPTPHVPPPGAVPHGTPVEGTPTLRAGSPAVQAVLPGVGRRLGDFSIVRELGRGGMGVVFEAVQSGLNRRVALKVLNAALLNEDGVARFRREAEILARLDHPNVVRVFAVGEADGLPYYAMEYIDGTPLDVVLRMGRMRLAQAVDVAAQAASGLAGAHAAGVVHRDVKPSNLLVAKDGRIVLTDFGLARGEEGSQLTATGQVIGTPMYMAPEQARGHGRLADARSDVFSLGATLYEVIAGRPPFQGDDVTIVLQRVANEEPSTLRTLDRGVPRDLNAIVMTCLAKDPGSRYASAADLKEDLDRFRRGEPVHARLPGPLARLGKWVRRHRIASAAALVVVVAGAVSAAYAWSVKTREEALRAAIVSSAAREREGRPSEALGVLEDASKALGADPSLDTALARIHLRFHRPEDALADLDRGAAAGALPADAAVLRARAELALGRADRALAALSNAPAVAETARVRASALVALDRAEEALAVLDDAFDQAASSEADAREIAGDAAELLLALGREAEALERIEAVRRDSVRVLFLWSEAQVRVGLAGEAAEAVEEALDRIQTLPRESAIDEARVFVARWRAHKPIDATDRDPLRTGLLAPPIDSAAALLYARTEEQAWRERLTEAVLGTDRVCAEAQLLHGVALLDRESGEKRHKARNYIERALQMDPKSIEARFALGRLLLEDGAVGEALPNLEAVAKQRPGDPSALQALGRARITAGDASGRELLARAVRELRTKGWGAFLHGRGLSQLREAFGPGDGFASDHVIWEAREGFTRALQADPEFGPASADIGRAIFAQAPLDATQNAAALAFVGRALALNPLDPDALLLRVLVLREGAEPRDLTRALTAADDAVAAIEGNAERLPRARVERALVRIERREWSEALADLDAAGATFPMALHARRVALEALGRADEARSAALAWAAQAATRDAEEAADLYLVAARRGSKRKTDLRRALGLIERARQEAPRYSPVYDQLAEVQKSLGLHVEALSSYAKALRLDEARYATRFYAKAYQFRVFMLSEEALAKVRGQAASAPPGDVSLHLALAFVCSLRAREEADARREGLAAVDRVLDAEPRFATARGLRGLLLGWDGRVEEGLDEIAAARGAAPGLGLLPYFQARVLAAAGRTEEARSALAEALNRDPGVGALVAQDADTEEIR
ncbi:MAG: protein kinase [Planctomycetota bacterium]